jgi:hypothetical protein
MDADKLARLDAALTAIESRLDSLEAQRATARSDAGFDESQHPRSANGQFGSGGGGATKKSAKPEGPRAKAKRLAAEGNARILEERKSQGHGATGRMGYNGWRG